MALAGLLARPQSARAKVVPTGRLRSSPTLIFWIVVQARAEAAAPVDWVSAPCWPRMTGGSHPHWARTRLPTTVQSR